MSHSARSSLTRRPTTDARGWLQCTRCVLTTGCVFGTRTGASPPPPPTSSSHSVRHQDGLTDAAARRAPHLLLGAPHARAGPRAARSSHLARALCGVRGGGRSHALPRAALCTVCAVRGHAQDPARVCVGEETPALPHVYVYTHAHTCNYGFISQTEAAVNGRKNHANSVLERLPWLQVGHC